MESAEEDKEDLDIVLRESAHRDMGQNYLSS